jgi:hypothetical protein
MLAAAGAANWALTSDQFALQAPSLTGDLRYTSSAALLAAAGFSADSHPNVFTLRSREIERAITSIASISDAHVEVGLPNRVDIAVTEHQPVFALRRDGQTFLVDDSGVVLAQGSEAEPTALGLPIVEDLRSEPVAPLAVGHAIDAIDLASILQLGAVTPGLIDSGAASLALSVSDDDGFVMTAEPSGWQAIFGNYTPNLRPTDIIPRQVQCLRSLLGAREATVTTVYLSPLDERCGTFVPLATARATPTPTPAR